MSPSFDPLTQPLLGPHSVEASAGTGKTYSITLLWLRLLIERQLRVDQILVTTFTRAATAELEERLLDSLRRALEVARTGRGEGPEARVIENAQTRFSRQSLVSSLECALSSFDLAPIHTIHGFCQSVIARHALELSCDPNLELTQDTNWLLEELVHDELMRNAERTTLDPKDAIRVAQTIAAEPLAELLAPVAPDEVHAEAHALIAPLLEQVQHLKLAARTSESIKTKLVSLRDTGSAPDFTQAQRVALAPWADELDQAVHRTRALHRALKTAALHPIAAAVRQGLAERKSTASIRTFDDILLTVHAALTAQGEDGLLARTLRERYRAAIVDECQDSDGIQIEVFQRLFTKAESFIIIGDPKQSIYRFRGADLASYRRLGQIAQRAADMTTNYRSDRPLVCALNALYSRMPVFRGGTAESPIRYVEVTAAAEAARIDDPRLNEPLLIIWSKESDRQTACRDLARRTAREFRRLLDEQVTILDSETKLPRRLIASDLAVLTLSHAQLSLVRRELLALGLPCEQSGQGLGSIWKSDEAADVQSWLEALVSLDERRDSLSAVLTFAATPLVGYSAVELEQLRDSPVLQSAFMERLSSDLTRLRHEGPLGVLTSHLRAETRLESRLGSRDGERRVTNWRQVAQLLQVEWTTGRVSASELRLWCARQRGQSGDDDSSVLMKLETDLPAVHLATVFGSKGLEYPVVACPFLWNVKSRAFRRRAPVAVVRHAQLPFVDVGSAKFDEHLDESIEQEEQEQERLLYVALTRARHRLYLGLAPVDEGGEHGNGAEQSALLRLLGLADEPKSAWSSKCPVPLLELPSDLVELPRVTTVSEPAVALAAMPVPRTNLGPLIRCSSYSGLVRSAESLTRDHDPDDSAELRKAPGLLGELKVSGNRLGQRIHSLLEDILGNGRCLDEVCQSLEPAWRQALQGILETPLSFGSDAFCLAQLQNRLITEMHFLLPVRTLSPGRLAHALLCDPSIAEDATRHAWAERIRDFAFGTLAGYFQGYIDLVFERDGRFYVVDYKTNCLSGYGPPALEAAMLDHHYLLQARLYLLALHRHLKATLEGYSPERHLGGAAYLFVRGFPEQGIWFERPNVAAILALDALCAEAGS